MKIKKTCENCQDQMVCIAYGKDTSKPCEDWTISLDTFQKILEENKITDPNEIYKTLNKVFR